MIRTTELRLGNLVYDESLDKIIRVNRIEHGCIENHYDEGVLSGIPLTEEWLMKAGFIDNGATFSKSPDMIVNKDFSSVGIYSDFSEEDIPLPCPMYVHQLQNLYFALTGQELPFS